MSLERSTLLDSGPSDPTWQYDRRGSKASHTSSSGRSTINDGRHEDGFFTPNYKTSAEVRASALLALSNNLMKNREEESRDSSIDPIMLPRKPKAETNLFPVDVEDEDTEDDGHSPLNLQLNSSSEQSSFLAHVHTVSADDISKTSSDSGIRHSPPTEEVSNEHNSLWPESNLRTWEIDHSKLSTNHDSNSNIISPYMAPMISVEADELSTPNENGMPFPTNVYENYSDQSGVFGSSSSYKIQNKGTLIPKRKTSIKKATENFSTPTLGLAQTHRSINDSQNHLDMNRDLITATSHSLSSLSVSRISLQRENAEAAAVGPSAAAAAVTEFDRFGQQEASPAALQHWNLSSEFASQHSIPFPPGRGGATMNYEGDKVDYIAARTSERDQDSPPNTPISPIQRASLTLQKLNNFKSNFFGGTSQKSENSNSVMKSRISVIRDGSNEPASTSALALSGLPAPADYTNENSYVDTQQQDIPTENIGHKSEFPPSSSKNWSIRDGMRTSIGSQSSLSGSSKDASKSFSSIKGRLRSLSGNLRRRSLRLDNGDMNDNHSRENARIISSTSEMAFNQSRNASLPASTERIGQNENPSPLMHAIQPLARQSSLTIASLATKKQASQPNVGSNIGVSSDIQSEILRPEDAAMPYIASQRLLRPATSTGVPSDQTNSMPVMASGWSFPVKQQETSDVISRPSLNTATTLSSSSIPTLHNVRRKPVPGLNEEQRPRTASSASAMVEANTNDSDKTTLSVGKTPRLRNAVSSTGLHSQFSGASNAKEHNATLPAILVPSNFNSQSRSNSSSQFGPSYPRRRSSFNYQSTTSLTNIQKIDNEEPVSPLTQTQPLPKAEGEAQIQARREAESSSVDTITQPITPRRGSVSSYTKHAPLHLNVGGNNVNGGMTNGVHDMNDRRKSSSAYSSNLATPQQTKGGGMNTISISPRGSDAWQGYKQPNMSVESNFSHLTSNVRVRTSPEAHRPSVTSLFSQVDTQFLQRPNSSQQQRSSQSPANGIYESNLQTYLNEEDLQVIEEDPIISKNLDLLHIRHRLAVEFANLGSKWSGSNRPLSIRSRRMSSETMREDAQSMYDGQMGTNGEQIESTSKWSLFSGSEKDQKKRREALETRERELTVEVLSKAEMAYAHIDIWTESRKGKWIVRCPAPDDSYPEEQLPDISDPWIIPIDAKGIVRRKKLKSNIELSSTRTIIVCPDCREAAQLNIAHNCKTCNGSERVEMVYTVQCIVRIAQFLPLKLPAALLLGTKQAHIKYIDAADPDHRTDILRDRALEGLQSSAARVIRVHNAQHGSRLLMGRVKITRIGLLSVNVRSNKSKTRRVFDVEDGSNGSIVEVIQSTNSSNGRASVMSMDSSKIRRSSSRKSFTTDRLNSLEGNGGDGDSIKSGKTNKSLFYSLTGGSSSSRKKKYGNASSPNLSQTLHQYNDSSTMPAMPQNSNTFGRHHSRNLSDDQGNFYQSESNLQSAHYHSNATNISRKKSLKSLFRQH